VALPHIWRAVYSWGASVPSRWKDSRTVLAVCVLSASDPGHTVTIDETPSTDWARRELTGL